MSDYDYSIHYARYHDDSDEHAEVMANYLSGFLSRHLPVSRDARILDVGCGYGFALRALQNAGYRNIAGVEVSESQAARARTAGFDVKVVSSTSDWLMDHSRSFDCILLLDVLEHIPVANQIAFLRSVATALRKPGGRLILTVPNASSPLAARWRYIDYTHHSSFVESSLDFVLKNAGFDSVVIESRPWVGSFPYKFWRKGYRKTLRKWLVRWAWLQVFMAELPHENLDAVSCELNLLAVADLTDDRML